MSTGSGQGHPNWQWMKNQNAMCCTGTEFGFTLVPTVHYEWTYCRNSKKCSFGCRIKGGREAIHWYARTTGGKRAGEKEDEE